MDRGYGGKTKALDDYEVVVAGGEGGGGDFNNASFHRSAECGKQI